MNWRLLAEGAIAINRGVPWVATNVDPTVPSPRGPLPGNGSLVAALRHATRREPVVTGKPDPAMHRESLLRSEAENPIVVGDRLDTDIEGATAVGCASLLVLSGVTTAADLLAAPPRLRPTYLAADAGGLLITHPQPELDDAIATCGAWQARYDSSGRRLTLRRSKDGPSAGEAIEVGDSAGDLDALRALCTACWAATPSAQEGGDRAPKSDLDRSRSPRRPVDTDDERSGVRVEAGSAGDDPDTAAIAVIDRLGLG
jgi:phosphoglycolate phosphatase-like HAD superfamily hydrolase